MPRCEMASVINAVPTSQVLKKHLGSVHTSSSLSSVQRKVINILLENAFSTIIEDTEHKISIKDLLEPIGWSSDSKVPETFRDSLKELAKIQIQWNVLEKDKKNKWISSSFLAHVGIKDGFVYYSFSLALRQLFGAPNIYAKLDLSVQKHFKVKYSVIFWELICGDLSSKKVDKVSTGWISYEKILALTGLTNHCYANRYSAFIEKVLDPSIQEINTYSDILVRYDLKKTKKQITHVCFFGEKKSGGTDIKTNTEIDFIQKKLEHVGIDEHVLQKFSPQYTPDQIERALDFFDYYQKTSKETIKNPVAFLKKTLEEGWVKLNDRQIVDQKTVTDVVQAIHSLDEPEACINFRLLLAKEIGETDYKSWFVRCTMKMSNSCIRIQVRSEFLRSYLSNNFSSTLNQIVRNFLPEIQGVVIEVVDL